MTTLARSHHDCLMSFYNGSERLFQLSHSTSRLTEWSSIRATKRSLVELNPMQIGLSWNFITWSDHQIIIEASLKFVVTPGSQLTAWMDTGNPNIPGNLLTGAPMHRCRCTDADADAPMPMHRCRCKCTDADAPMPMYRCRCTDAHVRRRVLESFMSFSCLYKIMFILVNVIQMLLRCKHL